MSIQPSDGPEPWEIALEQLRAEYARLVPWRSPTQLQDEVVWAYGRLEETYRRVRKEQQMKKADQENVNYILKWKMEEAEQFFCISHYFHFRGAGYDPNQAWRMLISFFDEAYKLAGNKK